MKEIILVFSFIFIGILFTGCGTSVSSEILEPTTIPQSLGLTKEEKEEIKGAGCCGSLFILLGDTLYFDKKYANEGYSKTRVKSWIISEPDLIEFKKEYPLFLAEYAQLKPQIVNWINHVSGLKPKYSFKNSENIDPIIMKSIEKNIISKTYPEGFFRPEYIYSTWKKYLEKNKYNYNKPATEDINKFLKEEYPIYLYSISSDYARRIESFTPKADIWDKDKEGKFLYYRQIFEKDIDNVIINVKDGVKYKFLPDKFSANDENINASFSFEKVQGYNKGYYYVVVGNKTGEYINIKSVSMYIGEDIISYKNLFKLPPYGKNLAENIKFQIETQYQFVDSKLMNYGLAVEYEINGKNKTLFIQKQNKE